MDSKSESSDDSFDIFDWDSDACNDQLEIEYFQDTGDDQVAVSSTSSSHNAGLIDHFVEMGFSEMMVIRAMKENDEENTEAILTSLLSYPALETGEGPSTSRAAFQYSDISDGDSSCAEEKDAEKDTISRLLDMGYEPFHALKAIERCGTGAPLDELTDFIFAAQTVGEDCYDLTTPPKKRKLAEASFRSRQQPRQSCQRDDFRVSLGSASKMIGFGVPGYSTGMISRNIPKAALGPPYFYYENVALTPKGTWEAISRYLYDIRPEFVDSLHFSAAARKRGYIHNLPIHNRQPLIPIPPKTIHEALPDTKKWWPVWDTREKFNCLLTCVGSAPLADRIRKRVESGQPSESDKKFVMYHCKKWNLVWVGKNKVAPLEPTEMELLLGYPKNHTRGGGISQTDRYKGLGNTFQIDTVAYHLSVLKPLYPQGMTVLSLFSGIGGAEVALHRLGIPLKAVVSVEISEVNRRIISDWWEQTEQRGQLIHYHDVEKVDDSMIRGWINKLGGFDLVIGGSPCNNLAGGNRRTRDGLEGEHSSLFYHYIRILESVRSMMRAR